MGTERFDVVIEALVASPIHSYEGRPGDGPRPTSGDSRESIEIRAGLGVVGDRYFGRAAHRLASVTVMAAESLDHVATALGLGRLDPGLARRNIVIRGAGVDSWRGRRFSLDTGGGPVEFEAHRPANPCAWMDMVYAPGAFRELRGRGGMRCSPITDGALRLGPATLLLHPDDPTAPSPAARMKEKTSPNRPGSA
ncbi:MAG: MOSC domain-containing protein [Naasia sp.]